MHFSRIVGDTTQVVKRQHSQDISLWHALLYFIILSFILPLVSLLSQIGVYLCACVYLLIISYFHLKSTYFLIKEDTHLSIHQLVTKIFMTHYSVQSAFYALFSLL